MKFMKLRCIKQVFLLTVSAFGVLLFFQGISIILRDNFVRTYQFSNTYVFITAVCINRIF